MKKCIQEAWEFYDNWRKNKTYCPALNCEIKISLKGWHHISGTGNGPSRLFGDIYRRLKLLPYAREIIQKSTTIQNIINKNGKTFYALEAMVEIKINGKNNFKKVRVILVEDKGKNKIFYSVMAK